MRVFPSVLGVLLSASLVAGCGSSSDTTTPTTPSAPTGPVTESFSSALATGGATSRTFAVATAGAVTVTLTDANPNLVIGLGVGVSQVPGAICALTYSVNTSKGTVPQISTTADVGSYCVEVFDVGNLPPNTAIAFTVSVVHP